MRDFFSQFQHHRPLKELCTFGIGGPAKHYIEVSEQALLSALLAFCNAHQLPFFVLGKGSNVLFDDRGFNGLVIHNKISFVQKRSPTLWRVGAGFSFSRLGTQTAKEDLAGLEFACGIPGSVGGAVFMNAGANGQETADSLVEVEFLDQAGNLLHYRKEELSFGYRFSSFQHQRGAIVAATFSLTPSKEARERQLQILSYRTSTQPYGEKSAGCVFRNPVCKHAGALIDQSGLKGSSIGGAAVSAVHANFLINTGSATAHDVKMLIEHVQKEVFEQTGEHLEPEVRWIPYDENKAS